MSVIIDEFTKLPISRERKRQLRCKKAGICKRCDRPLATKNYCLRHAIEERDRRRKLRGNTETYQSLTRRLEKGIK